MLFFPSRCAALLRPALLTLSDRPATAACLAGLGLGSVALFGVMDPASGRLELLAALWLLALLAALSLRRVRQRLLAPPPLLLTRRALRHPPQPLPPALQMRADLTALLSSPAPMGAGLESADHAVRWVLERCLLRHGDRAVETLDRPVLIELWLLATLLRAAPERAGALAQCFRLPHRVLALRDQMPANAATARVALRLRRPAGRGPHRGPQLSA